MSLRSKCWLLEQILHHSGLSTLWSLVILWILEQIPQRIHPISLKFSTLEKKIIDQNDLKPSLAPTLRLQEKSTQQIVQATWGKRIYNPLSGWMLMHIVCILWLSPTTKATQVSEYHFVSKPAGDFWYIVKSWGSEASPSATH